MNTICSLSAPCVLRTMQCFVVSMICVQAMQVTCCKVQACVGVSEDEMDDSNATSCVCAYVYLCGGVIL